MVSYLKEPYKQEEINVMLHPLVRKWFFSQFEDYSPPQRYSIVTIHKRKNILLSSPTGSGKTLSAFLAILNELVVLSLEGRLENKVYAVYVSPLKALGNDIQRNLLGPLQQLEKLAQDEGRTLGIRVGVRTGDTTSYQKAMMLKKPPHILITTPESLGIMITTLKFKEKLTSIDWVIVDEIHALAENKRGVHLSLTLERMERLCSGFCRVGLSATVSPLEEVAKFLVGYDDGWRDCIVVDVNLLKELDLKVLSPVKNLIREDYETVMRKTYALIHSLIQDHKTTLIFTNTRSATERVVHYLKLYYPEHYAENIAAHHGSLSKEHRLSVEEDLKDGKLKVAVSSTSLELGIDIGSIDLVILLSSPKSVARALQRIGRSGHRLHEKSKGRIIVQDRDDLVECAVLLKAALEGKIDTLHIPTGCLDVLAQQLVGIALEGKISEEELWRLVRNSYCYKDLSREHFDSLLSYLAGEYVALEHRHVYAKVWKDDGMIGKKGKLARLIYMTNIGTIPDEANVKVKIGEQVIGTVSEGFLEKLRKGDVFVLGGQTFEFRGALGMTAQVKSAVGRRPTVPSWYSEMLPLSFDLAREIQKFRRYMEQYFGAKSKKDIMEFIDKYLYIDAWGAYSLYEYFLEQYKFAVIPHDKQLVIEHYHDGKNRYVFFHSLYGRRANDVLSRCVAFVVGRLQQRDVEIMINDNGFAIRTLGSVQAARALRLLRSDELRRIAERSLEKTEVLARRFRHCAARAFMILRNYKGRRKSVGRQQMSSRMLLSSVKRIDADFVILKEARREVLEDLMDIRGAMNVVTRIEKKDISLREIHTDVPSPFAFNLLLTGYTDIMKMHDRQAFLRKMHEMVLAKISLQQDAPKELVEQAGYNPSFDYEEFWGFEDDKKELSEQEKIDKMVLQVRSICKKLDIDFIIAQDLEKLIVGGKNKYREESFLFLRDLLSGTVPKIWPDDIVKVFARKIDEMGWSTNHKL